ncbi:MAG: outer membrane protein transport protein [Rhodoferax sp.]|uniref:OmpP1/FadL family transporter n=1 Tax=Rhodoferax sp. TaxID=50421 RepID=UPI0030190B72
MPRVSPMKLIPALCLGLCSGYASAAGFQLLEQNASGLGNAYAGSAAVSENASTIFFNPAGMTQLKDREFSAGVAGIGTSFKFSDSGSPVTSLVGNGGDGGGWGFIPNGYLSWALNQDVYVGVGVNAPFGLKTEYNNPWIGAAQSTKFDLKTYNVNPSIAYRVNDAVSIGAGLNWQRLTAEYTRQVGVASVFALSPLKLNLDGDAWGWNVGGLFKVAPGSKVGVSYRSTVNYDLTGDISVTGPNALVNAGGSSGAKASLKLPDAFILSGTQQVSDKWQMLSDLSWTGWSSIPKIDVIRTSGAGSGTIAQTLDTDFQDTWRLAVGANYQYSNDMKLKFGIAYDQTPVKGAASRLVSLPDNDRTWFSFGTQWTQSKGATLDLGVSYLYVKDADIKNNQTSADPTKNRGLVSGTYSDSVWILGLQYSTAF